MNQRAEISISFLDKRPVETVVDCICNLNSPQILLWYIGTYGLKEGSVQFYREKIIQPILAKSTSTFPSFLLVDLTAWLSLKNSLFLPTKYNHFADVIDGFDLHFLKTYRSADFFADLPKIKDHQIIEAFHKNLVKEELHKPSHAFAEINQQIGSLWPEHCLALAPIQSFDCAKCYSALQYLEAFFLIEKAILNALEKNDSKLVEIAFCLPNDENKYYLFNEINFELEIGHFLDKRIGFKITKKIIKIHFYSFEYGEQEFHRPYNAPGKTLKRNQLTKSDVIGEVGNEQQNGASIL